MTYDLVIIGGSAAGASAAIYGARRKLNLLMISEDFGGEVAQAGEIENYPGVVKTDGITLAEDFRKHVEANGVTPELNVRVGAITKDGEDFVIAATKNGENVEYRAYAVIVATGVHPRYLEVPGEKEFTGKGVTWCTTCDGPLFRNKKVVTVGGGNSALESALMLAEIASHVTLINKNDHFKGEQVLIDKVTAHENIDIVYNAKTTVITGELTVNGVDYVDAEGTTQHVETQGVFIHIGLIPNSLMVGSDVVKNKMGEIEVNQKCETSVTGLFAAGDVTNVPYKQIAIATGQGVTAALAAIDYLNRRGA